MTSHLGSSLRQVKPQARARGRELTGDEPAARTARRALYERLDTERRFQPICFGFVIRTGRALRILVAAGACMLSRSRPTATLAAALGIAAACAASRAETPISAPRAPMRVGAHIDLASPAQGAVLREPRAHVSGSVRVMRDVVLLIDRSGSTRDVAGRDVDGDGEIGHVAFGRRTSDEGDTVFAAEVRAARAYLEALDPASDRAAVLSFTVDTEVVAPLGTPEAAATALAAWKPEQIVGRKCWLQKPNGKRVAILEIPSRGLVMCKGGTSLSNALFGAAKLFAGRDATAPQRLPVFVVFSDGEAVSPDPSTARRSALRAAEFLSDHGTTVHGVNFGSPFHSVQRNVMREVVELSGGMFVDTRDDGAHERLVALARRAIEGVELSNLTTREPGNAALSADGRAFAGEAALAPGENRLGLRFLLTSSIGFAREIVVDFQPSASP